jgi:hypothetical protein
LAFSEVPIEIESQAAIRSLDVLIAFYRKNPIDELIAKRDRIKGLVAEKETLEKRLSDMNQEVGLHG